MAPGAARRPRDGREWRCLRLRGLPFGTTEAQLTAFLSPCAEAETVIVCRQEGACARARAGVGGLQNSGFHAPSFAA
jgi:hypothetical protein